MRYAQLLLMPLIAACHSNAPAPIMVHGFENGFSDWKTLGDASIQTSAVGLNPTEGRNMAFITTMADRSREASFSGTESPKADTARVFLGLPYDGVAFLKLMSPGTRPDMSTDAPIVGESAAIKTRFYIAEPSVVSFDWNRIGADGDSAYFTLWADNASGVRWNGWLVNRDTAPASFVSSRVDLCPRYLRPDGSSRCIDTDLMGTRELLDVETGWKTRSILLSRPGWYWLGFALGEIAESTVPTVLAIDNVRIEPEFNKSAQTGDQ